MSSTPHCDRTEAQKLYHLEYNRQWRKRNKQRKAELDKVYRERHKDTLSVRDKLYRERCQVQRSNTAKKRYLRQKQEAITLLGGRCVHCQGDDIRCLEIDHIIPVRGDRSIYGAKLYRSVASGGSTENLQVLCANCHAIKTYEDGNGVA